MSKRDAIGTVQAEDLDRKPPDGAGDPVAIEVERCEVWRAYIGYDIHFHAVDDRKEVFALKPEIADGYDEAAHPRRCCAGIKSVDISTPPLQLFEPHIARAAFVGNVIDRSAV